MNAFNVFAQVGGVRSLETTTLVGTNILLETQVSFQVVEQRSSFIEFLKAAGIWTN